MIVSEKKLFGLGLYVAYPINFQLLFTQSERDVLNTIRHLNNIDSRCISLSLIRLYTGLSVKTIQSALHNLETLGVVSRSSTCKAGTYYSVVYKKLGKALKRLREVRNPVERLRIADAFRGDALAKNKGVVEEFTNSSFDTNI